MVDELKTIGKGLQRAHVTRDRDEDGGASATLAVHDHERAAGDGGWITVRPGDRTRKVELDGLQRWTAIPEVLPLRFPRICLVARIRDDQKPEESDTLETVIVLWQRAAREAVTRGKLGTGREEEARPEVGATARYSQKSKQLQLFDGRVNGTRE